MLDSMGEVWGWNSNCYSPERAEIFDEEVITQGAEIPQLYIERE
jgi:hypothetical protein